MGFFSQGTDQNMNPVKAGFGSLTGDWGAQAGGNTDRTTAAWNQQQGQQAQYANLLAGVQAGQYATPGRAARAVDYGNMQANEDWWNNLRGGAGTTALVDSTGKPITQFTDIANQGMMTPEQMYAMRERPASQARSATSSMLDTLRRGGISGWGGGGAAGALAAQKNLLSSLRSGNLEANASIADMTNQQRQWGYGQMEGAQSQAQALDDAMRQERASAWASGSRGGGPAENFAQQMAILGQMGGDPTAWAGLTNNSLAGQGSALSGWGGAVQGARTPSTFSQVAPFISNLANTAGNVWG